MLIFFAALEIFLLSLGLGMDAFAVSITNGMTVHRFSTKHAVLQGIYFGIFQFTMPLLGFLLGAGFISYISAFDHWIAFGLLSAIGVHMIWSAMGKGKECTEGARVLTHKKLLLQAIATSIDALAVGVSMYVMNVNIWVAAAVIGVMAFILSFVGGILGKSICGAFNRRAEVFGGLILIAIGVHILLEHMVFNSH